MRPSRTANFNGIRSPVPYLLGVIGFIFLLIALALIILICTKREPSGTESSLSRSVSAEKPPAIAALVMEPKFVVIMAGEIKPTFLARPFSLDHHIGSTP